jgi:hypothetical protein
MNNDSLKKCQVQGGVDKLHRLLKDILNSILLSCDRESPYGKEGVCERLPTDCLRA